MSGRRRLGSGNRTARPRLRYFCPARLHPLDRLGLHSRQGSPDRPRAPGKRRQRPFLSRCSSTIRLRSGSIRVRDKNLRPRDGKPFSSLSAQRAQPGDDGSRQTKSRSFAKAISERNAATAAREIKLPNLLTPEIAGIVGAIKGRGRSEPATLDELRPHGPAVLDIGGLPETGYERLVGREAELARLDEAWRDGKTSILSLVAEGGAGKSALVNEWLARCKSATIIAARLGARLVVLQPRLERTRDLRPTCFSTGRWRKLGVKVEFDQRFRQGRSDRRGAHKPPRPPGARRRRAVAARARSASGRTQGPRLASAVAPLRRRAAGGRPQPDRADEPYCCRRCSALQRRPGPGRRRRAPFGRGGRGALARQRCLGRRQRAESAASRDFGGHPLALTLLASFLRKPRTATSAGATISAAFSPTPTIRATIRRGG